MISHETHELLESSGRTGNSLCEPTSVGRVTPCALPAGRGLPSLLVFRPFRVFSVFRGFKFHHV